MATNRFFIAPYDQKSGLQTNVKPWLVPDSAFSQLTNAYVFRGRVRKRFGSRWFLDSPLTSRLRVQVSTTDGSGNTPAGTFVPRSGGIPIVTPAIGQLFSIDDQVFTVVALGNPSVMLISGTATLATFDTTTGELVINGAMAGSSIYYYPALPVMGLLSYEQATINDEIIIGFDTHYAYRYASGWMRIDSEDVSSPGAATWTGDNSQFFWGTTWTGTNASDKIFFVTNFNENEPNYMRYYDGSKWYNFRPQVEATEYLNSARIIVSFKNRLLAFNTWEGAGSPGSNYNSRVRWSQVGSPLAANAWRRDIPGKGGGLDASTTESLVTVEFVKDRLICFFERSTWELVYLGNQVQAFTFQQINTELGAESTFSVVPFDKVALGVGNVGIMACNGANVERIDEKIPQEVFDIHNADGGVFRVYGIRDYYVEMVYWTFPDTEATADYPYPKRVLIYNYKNGTWAINNDSITAFGYFQPTSGITWDSTTITWDDAVSWDSGSIQAKFRQVVAGNQEGYTFICDADVATNASVLQITNLTVSNNIITLTVIDHNLLESGDTGQDYIYLSGITGTGNLTTLNNKIFAVINSAANPITPNQFSFAYKDDQSTVIAGTYSGGGLISRVSNITVTTKEYNFYADEGRNAYISKVDFMVDATPAGQTQVEFFVSTAVTPLLQQSASNGVLLGTGTLDTFPYPSIPFEETATRLWHPVYFQADGEFVQFKLQMNDSQMRDIDIRQCGFALHALCIYAMPSSMRFQ